MQLCVATCAVVAALLVLDNAPDETLERHVGKFPKLALRLQRHKKRKCSAGLESGAKLDELPHVYDNLRQHMKATSESSIGPAATHMDMRLLDIGLDHEKREPLMASSWQLQLRKGLALRSLATEHSAWKIAKNAQSNGKRGETSLKNFPKVACFKAVYGDDAGLVNLKYALIRGEKLLKYEAAASNAAASVPFFFAWTILRGTRDEHLTALHQHCESQEGWKRLRREGVDAWFSGCVNAYEAQYVASRPVADSVPSPDLILAPPTINQAGAAQSASSTGDAPNNDTGWSNSEPSDSWRSDQQVPTFATNPMTQAKQIHTGGTVAISPWTAAASLWMFEERDHGPVLFDLPQMPGG